MACAHCFAIFVQICTLLIDSDVYLQKMSLHHVCHHATFDFTVISHCTYTTYLFLYFSGKVLKKINH